MQYNAQWNEEGVIMYEYKKPRLKFYVVYKELE